MEKDNVISIHQQKSFTLYQAAEALPMVFKWTKEAMNLVDPFMQLLEETQMRDEDTYMSDVEAKIDEVLMDWQRKVRCLGGKTSGVWRVDFDNGKGLWSWEFPERQILYWRAYNTAFETRRKISLKDGERFMYSDENIPHD